MRINIIKPNPFLIALLLGLTALTLASAPQAQVKKEKGHKGHFCKANEKESNCIKRLRSEFEKDKSVEGYIIKGSAIIKIIETTDLDIKIKNSIIEGELDFTKLPSYTIAELKGKKKWPQNWSKLESRNFQADLPSNKVEFHLVDNEVKIIASEMKSDSEYSIRTEFTMFLKNQDYSDTSFNGWASFNFATFSRNANFSTATFNRAGFGGATFSRKAEFFNTTFRELATFGGTNFTRGASHATFAWAIFHGKAFFKGTIFNRSADFGNALFDGGAEFSGATFNGDASFPSAVFNKHAAFKNTHFLSGLSLRSTVFTQYLDMRSTKVRRLDYDSAYSPTIVSGRIDFRNAVITEAHFQDIIFESDVDFSDTKIGLPLTTVNVGKLPGDLKLLEFHSDKIQYNDEAHVLTFTGVMTLLEKDELLKLSVDPNYHDAVEQLFSGSTSMHSPATVFRYVIFESDTNFLRTQFFGDTSLERITFKGEANFTDADFSEKDDNDSQRFSLSYLNFKTLRLGFDQLPEPESWVNEPEERLKGFTGKDSTEHLEPLSQVFRGLESNFRALGQLSDANQAYYYMKVAELRETKNGDNGSQKVWKKAEWFFWGVPSGYGTKIWWIIGWSIFFNLLFAIIYCLKGEINRQSHPDTKMEFTFKQRLFDLPKQYLTRSGPLDVRNESLRKFIDALRFSTVVLLKVGYRDTTVSGKISGIDFKYIVWIEWALGFYLLAALAVTLSNTVPVINGLITGVF